MDRSLQLRGQVVDQRLVGVGVDLALEQLFGTGHGQGGHLLAQILAVGREKNTALGVTGILAHKGENCLGILEGADEVVRARFEQVRMDPRHTNVRVLLDEEIQQRSFPDWSMAFQPLDPLMQEVPGFRDLFSSGQAVDPAAGLTRARGLLEWFRKHPLA
ncbi:MAG: BLUF domain-containing protein, partial [Caulobacteraceae bacterium]